jgi:23S rRNA (cytosine1962-C5)-methyltransferase
MLHDMVKLTASLLSDRPLFYLINSYTIGLAPAVLTYLIYTEIVKRFGGHADAQEVGLPVTDTGLILPCGAAGRWQAE